MNDKLEPREICEPLPMADGSPPAWRGVRQSATWQLYLVASAVLALCTLVGWGSHALGLTEANVVMIFLAGVALIAARLGQGPAIAAAILSVLVFDFFFVKPVFGFTPSDAQYFITLGVMLGIGLLISELVARLREQLAASQQQEHRTAQLYQMTRQLSTSAGTELLVRTAGEQLAAAFDGQIVLYLRESQGGLRLAYGQDTPLAQSERAGAVAEWALAHRASAGAGTAAFADARSMYVPMIGSRHALGVLGVLPQHAARFSDAEERQMLETCAHLIALSLERDQSQAEVQQAQVQVQAEQLRSALLSAVSHDLRTPLATIAATASSLVEDANPATWPEKLELLQTVVDESHRLTRQVDNLLDMARLNSGALVLNSDWHVLEEIVGLALTRLRRELQQRTVQVQIPDDFPLLWIAGDLVEQIFVNLLENAIRYTPPGSRIEIAAMRCQGHVEIRFADNGPGLPLGSEARVFEKFFRGQTVVADGRRGVGLGLAICQAIVQAHGGQIIAANRSSGGAEFKITLPCPPTGPEAAFNERTAEAIV